MKSGTLKTHSDEDFRRVTGVKRGTFAKMAEILATARIEKRKRRGRKPKLSLEEMLLATLEYLRECRTCARIAASYGTDESNMYRAIRWLEDVLAKEERRLFAVREKSPAERRHGLRGNLRGRDGNAYRASKKNSAGTIRARRSGTP